MKRSWWVPLGLVPFGWLGWIAFLYAGIRARRKRWVAFAACLAALTVATFALPDDTHVGWLAFANWALSAIGVFVIRGKYLELTGPERGSDAPTPRARAVDRPKPSWLLRNVVMRRVVLPLFSIGVLGFGVFLLIGALASLADAAALLPLGLVFTAIGLMMVVGAFTAEARYGSGWMPSILRPRFRHTLRTGSATGLHEYELRRPLVPRIAVASATAAFFLLPNLWWTPPVWLNAILLAVGVFAGAPFLRRPRMTLRIGPRRFEAEAAGARVVATAWEFGTVERNHNVFECVFMSDPEVTYEPTAWFTHFMNSLYGENIEERVLVDDFLVAARREGPEVERTLRADLESGTPEPVRRDDDDGIDVFKREPGATAFAAEGR